MDTVPKETHVVFSHDLLASGNEGKGQTETVTVVGLSSRKRKQQRSAARIDAQERVQHRTVDAPSPQDNNVLPKRVLEDF